MIKLIYREPKEGYGVAERSGEYIETSSMYSLPKELKTKAEREAYLRYYCEHNGILRYEGDIQV
jgi:hypothetical protein